MDHNDGARSARAIRKDKQKVVKVGDMRILRGSDGKFHCVSCYKVYVSASGLQVCL